MSGPRRIPHLRWWIIALLFFSTVINYVDRQALSVLARPIQDDLGMTDLQYARVVQAFLLAYTVAYLVAGRITDWLGTRVSMACFIVWWSVANMLTALSRTPLGLGAFRFLLGLGEPGNYTAAPKAVVEWFSPRERALAMGVYTAGATVGATIAPPLVVFLAARYGWRGAFVVTGALGLLWVLPWLWLYRRPEEHPRITPEELATLRASAAAQTPGASRPEAWGSLLRRREVWLLTAARMLTDPVWYFFLFWFPKYLTDERGLTLVQLGALVWVVYLAADVGSVAGGWLSGRVISKGVNPVVARKRVMSAAALLLPPTVFIASVPSEYAALALAMLAALGHMTWLVTLSALITDVFPEGSVATVFGIIAAGSGLGGLLSTEVVGRLVSGFSYGPVFLIMGFLHLAALALIWRVRARAQPAAT